MEFFLRQTRLVKLGLSVTDDRRFDDSESRGPAAVAAALLLARSKNEDT